MVHELQFNVEDPRENRIACFHYSNGTLHCRMIKEPLFSLFNWVVKMDFQSDDRWNELYRRIWLDTGDFSERIFWH